MLMMLINWVLAVEGDGRGRVKRCMSGNTLVDLLNVMKGFWGN